MPATLPKRREKCPDHGMVLQQPWAHMVAEGVFPALVRPIPTKIRCRVAVLAARTDPHALVDMRLPTPMEFPNGVLVGSVEVVDCVRVPRLKILDELRSRFGAEFAEFYPKHYIPKSGPTYLWTLTKPRLRKKPIPVGHLVSRVWRWVPKRWTY